MNRTSEASGSERLAGKAAIITGAAAGIGRETALLFAAEGAMVAAVDVDGDGAAAVAHEVTAAGGEAVAFTANVAVEADVEAAVVAAEEAFGRLDVVFNNAGIMLADDGDAQSTEEDIWDRTMDVNLKGVMNGVRAFVPRMREQDGRGHILNTGSLASLLPLESTGIYCVTKYSVLAISEVLSQELAPDGIGVSILCPGGVDTQINQAARNGAAVARESSTPAARAQVNGNTQNAY